MATAKQTTYPAGHLAGRPDATNSNGDALYGHFVTVQAGPHKGKYGVYDTTNTVDEAGRPVSVNIRTRDDNHELITVEYNDLVGDVAGKR